MNDSTKNLGFLPRVNEKENQGSTYLVVNASSTTVTNVSKIPSTLSFLNNCTFNGNVTLNLGEPMCKMQRVDEKQCTVSNSQSVDKSLIN